MRKIGILTVCMVLFISFAGYADWIDDLKQEAEETMEPVVGDIGAAISGGVLRAGSLSFPGLEAGIKVSASGISDDNQIISGSNLIVPWLYVELGLPKKINLFVRGLKYEIADSASQLTILGAGARYSLTKNKTASLIPNVAVVVAYNRLSVTDVSVNSISLGCSVSKKLPFITPYAGLSYDMISSKIETIAGTLKPSKNLFRIGGGIELKPFPFISLNGGLNLIDSNLGWDAGLGLKLELPI